MSNEEKYKKAINELADSYELHLKQWAKRCVDTINEYTTDLQQENRQLKEQLENKIDLYEDTISYQLGFEKGKEQLKQEILEFIDTLQGGDKQEFMGYGGYELLKIVGDKENECKRNV